MWTNVQPSTLPVSVDAINRKTLAGVAAAVIAIAFVVFVVRQLNAPVPAQLVRYHLGATNNQIVVTTARGHCDTVKDTRAREDASSVLVNVLIERSRGSCTADLVLEEVPITLASPLADRAVIGPEGPLPVEAR